MYVNTPIKTNTNVQILMYTSILQCTNTSILIQK